jgi:recombination protein RecR
LESQGLFDKYPESIERLIAELSHLPTIGRKSAQRLAFHLLKAPPERCYALARALQDLRDRVRLCSRCFYVTEAEVCTICSDAGRDHSLICVVEEPVDVAAFEKSGTYGGVYHCLLGLLSPLQGVTPDDLKIEDLMKRIGHSETPVREVIIATNPNVDGDATALYLAQLIEPLGIRVTRLGLGMPIGGSLEYTDELTLRKALESRREL